MAINFGMEQQMENYIENYRHSTRRKLDSVHFGPLKKVIDVVVNHII